MSLIVFVEFWNYWKCAINNSNVEVNRLKWCQKYINFYRSWNLSSPGDCSDGFWRTLGKLTALEGACQINRLNKIIIIFFLWKVINSGYPELFTKTLSINFELCCFIFIIYRNNTYLKVTKGSYNIIIQSGLKRWDFKMEKEWRNYNKRQVSWSPLKKSIHQYFQLNFSSHIISHFQTWNLPMVRFNLQKL